MVLKTFLTESKPEFFDDFLDVLPGMREGLGLDVREAAVDSPLKEVSWS